MKKKLASFISIILVFSFFAAMSVNAASVDGKNITSQGACVMDFDTGEVYYEHNGNVARVPASMTKLMSLYLVYEALEEGKISLDTNVPLSKNVRAIAFDYSIQGALRNCLRILLPLSSQ